MVFSKTIFTRSLRPRRRNYSIASRCGMIFFAIPVLNRVKALLQLIEIVAGAELSDADLI